MVLGVCPRVRIICSELGCVAPTLCDAQSPRSQDCKDIDINDRSRPAIKDYGKNSKWFTEGVSWERVGRGRIKEICHRQHRN
jgi:hypothetical protein